MAIPDQIHLRFTAAKQRLRQVPSWALLSLAINGVLFLTVLVVMRQSSATTESVLSQANAFASDATPATAAAAPQFGERQHLDYQQWVSLLQQEVNVAVQKGAPRQNILLGDSITLWFPTDLLPGRKTWLNQAISGENSTGLRQRLYVLDQAQPEAVFIMVGINDLIWGKSESQLIDNIRAMVIYLQDHHPGTRIVLQSILPHAAERATWEGKDKLLALPNQRIQAANAQIKAVADQTGVTYLDLYPLFADGEGKMRSDLTTDGVHLNHEGYMVWRTAIALVNETSFEP